MFKANEQILNELKENQKLCLNLFYTFGWLNNFYTTKLKKFGITTHQYNILRLLSRYYPEPASINILKECMPDKKSDVSRLIDRMMKSELVDRRICPMDRRKADVTIKIKGLELLERIKHLEESWIEELIKLSPEEVHLLNEKLEKLISKS